MKLRVKATNETLPVAEDSFICGLRPDGSEVEFIVSDVELIPDNWDAFRREAAKDILQSIIVTASQVYEMESLDKSIWCEQAIEWADTLIAKLKEK